MPNEIRDWYLLDGNENGNRIEWIKPRKAGGKEIIGHDRRACSDKRLRIVVLDNKPAQHKKQRHAKTCQPRGERVENRDTPIPEHTVYRVSEQHRIRCNPPQPC